MRTSTFILISLFALSLPAKALDAQNTCHVSDENSVAFIASLRAVMATQYSEMRTRFGLPQVDPAQIVLVSDSTICATAGTAVDSLMNIWDTVSPTLPPSTDPIYVIQIGTAYAVVDLNSPTEDPTEFDSAFMFSSGWVYRGIIAM